MEHLCKCDLNPETERIGTGNLTSIVAITSKVYGRVPRRVLWRADIDCTEREGLLCRAMCENEATDDICGLHKKGRLYHEVPCVPIRCGLFVYAYLPPMKQRSWWQPSA